MLSASEIPASSQDTAAGQQEPAKKATRHWDAWTHEEEEKFFLALRQVGKNFEKITTHVESKNRDQVRHYYYRLIKRMNKLLRSELSLDAKNSKDVTAAMLCWWSLLEKYRCSSSKLHLKPRRLKAFVSALEQQLLKDRKKTRKKTKVSSAETEPGNATSVAAGCTRKRSCTRNPVSVKCQSAVKETGSDIAVCIVSNDMENVAGANESPLTGMLQNSECPDLKSNQAVSSIRVSAPRIRSAGALKTKSETTGMSKEERRKLTGLSERIEDGSTPSASPKENPVLKIKLQLFPVDDTTRTALELDGHNPHLELTLKGSKSISSVIQHLSLKWGRSSAAVGELRLYPFIGQGGPCTSWGSEDALSAAEVYTALGKPAIFRLRYGWSPRCSNSEPPKPDDAKGLEQEIIHRARKLEEYSALRELDHQATSCGWLYEKSTDGFGQRLWRDEDPSNELGISPMDWADSLNVNVSQLLEDSTKQYSEPTRLPINSIWGGEETCDAFIFSRKEQLQEATTRQLCSRQNETDGSLLGNPQAGSSSFDVLRSSSLDLYWADSLGALDGTFTSIQGHSLLLNGNSSLGAGISGSLFGDSLDGFPHQLSKSTEPSSEARTADQ